MDLAKAWGECQPRGPAALAFWALQWRIVRGPLKKPVYRFIQRRCPAQDVEFEGIKLRCHIADNGPERFVIFPERRLEWDALRFSVDDLKPGEIFIDVGANFGLFSTVAAKNVGPAGRVISIEPHPELLRRLKFNIAANSFGQVTIIEAAVGAEAGDAVLYANPSSFAESSLVANAQRPGSQSVAFSVPTRTLYEIASTAGLSRIDSLKIDIEGYEDRALVPFLEAAPRHLWPRRVLIETIHARDWQVDCVARLTGAGYILHRETKSDALLVRPSA